MQLNGRLPADVSVRAAEICEPGFQPRFDAERKLYRYRVYCGLARDPLRARTAWYLGPGLARRDKITRDDDVHSFLYVDAMEEAARLLEGKHDFRAFKAESDDRENTIRTLFRVGIVAGFAGDRDGLAIEVEGDAFMKNMVRILSGTLLDIGRGKRAPRDVLRMLGPQARRMDAGPTAPANGLTLVRMELGRIARLKAESAARAGVIAAASMASPIRSE
jgi:tRNA pseudouridine38-40 synthase